MDISTDTIIEQNNEFNKNQEYKVTQSFLKKTYIDNVSANTEKLNKIVHKFNHEINEKISVTNQYHSGRCWIFAGLNIIRHKLIKKYDLDPSFQISQSYLFFYDKLEKCNYALEMLYQVLTDQTSIDYSVLRNCMLSDGGTWQEFANLVLKYGIIPQEAFPDTYQTQFSTNLNQILKYIIFRVKINKAMTRNEFNKIKEDTLVKCYRILSMCMGCPPTKFKFFFKKDKEREYTPLNFYSKFVKHAVNISDYVVICNDPRLDYHKLYNTEYLHNVLHKGDKDLKTKITNLYLNLPIEDLKKSIKQSIDHNTGVWFACDYSHHHHDRSKILDNEASQLEKIFDIDINISKKDSILAGNTIANHAMIFVGYHSVKTGEYERWKVENSHGIYANNNGLITMTDKWFNDYVICAAVHKKTLTPKNRALLKSKIHYLPFYDPLGIYAFRFGTLEKLMNNKCRNNTNSKLNLS